jgi:coproporphyrinogen III oxidase-like Fe-S oxidoreductase
MSNYIDRKKVLAEWELFFVEKQSDDYVSLTIRFPFCYSVCAYCQYYHERLKKRTDIDIWLARLDNEMKYFSHIFSHYQLKGVYLCGGTISIMSQLQLLKLSGIILKYFYIDQGAHFRFIEPSIENLSIEELDFYKSLPLNINRIGLGVQTFDTEVLRATGRFVSNKTKEEKLEIIKYANEIFPMCYVDFIHGLSGKTPQLVISEILEVIEYASIKKIHLFMLLKNPNSREIPKYAFFSKTEALQEIKFLAEQLMAVPEIAAKYRLSIHGGYVSIKLIRKDLQPFDSYVSQHPHIWNSSLSFGALAKSFIIPRKFYYLQHFSRFRSKYTKVPYNFSQIDQRRIDYSEEAKSQFMKRQSY